MIWETFQGLVYSGAGLAVGYWLGKLRRDVDAIKGELAEQERTLHGKG